MSKRSFILLLNCILALTVSAQSIEKLLLDGWRFHQGAAQGAEQAAYDDSQWQEVSIPHDWAISGPFDKDIDKYISEGIISQDIAKGLTKFGTNFQKVIENLVFDKLDRQDI